MVANAAIVPAGTGGEITAFASNDTDLIIDIDGYFALPTQQNPGLSLYPVAPCRVLDTRHVGNGQPFAGELTVDVVGSVCGPSSPAQAYVFNATVVPSGPLGYLTLWPDGGHAARSFDAERGGWSRSPRTWRLCPRRMARSTPSPPT